MAGGIGGENTYNGVSLDQESLALYQNYQTAYFSISSLLAGIPFHKIPEFRGTPAWVELRVVYQIRLSEWTKTGHMPYPMFLSLKDDPGLNQ